MGIVIEHLFLSFIRFRTVPMATDGDVSEPPHLQATWFHNRAKTQKAPREKRGAFPFSQVDAWSDVTSWQMGMGRSQHTKEHDGTGEKIPATVEGDAKGIEYASLEIPDLNRILARMRACLVQHVVLVAIPLVVRLMAARGGGAMSTPTASQRPGRRLPHRSGWSLR